ncbi:helix-turn-helix domain-containing protein [Arthrobacter mobilis]|uniref:Helix-turn-helix domain-containing protein n=1 Tax=Arthrobacter mobilis TaxID=2724944 RepID=A0A7X6HCX0_9MICC|nr:helix-turn-helix domain-containing protein [Arthrobacter mobilis]NKX54821.1 helix-turn-helix domain-containing protein [Arthrobacter mobilis]
MGFGTPSVVATAFSTTQVPRQDRLPLWEEHNKRSLIDLHCRTLAAAGLLAAQRNLRLPRLRFTEMKGNDHVVERSPENIRSTPADTLPLCLLLEGQAFYYHSDGCEVLGAGDAILYDADRPFMYGFSTSMRQVILEVPRGLYEERTGQSGLPSPRVLRPGPGLPFAAHALAAVRTIRDALQAPPPDPQQVEDSALDLFDLLTGTHAGTSGYLPSARDYIRRHLHEPDLSAARIARAVGISDRHLTRVFAAAGTTATREIMDARLRRAADKLADPQLRSTPIGAIAASVGFVSAAHFSRAFKQAYGRTPRDARAD